VTTEWAPSVSVTGKLRDGTPVVTTLHANLIGTLGHDDYAVRHYRSATGMDVDDVEVALAELLRKHARAALAATKLEDASELVLGRDILASIDATELAALNVKWDGSLRVRGINVIATDLVKELVQPKPNNAHETYVGFLIPPFGQHSGQTDYGLPPRQSQRWIYNGETKHNELTHGDNWGVHDQL